MFSRESFVHETSPRPAQLLTIRSGVKNELYEILNNKCNDMFSLSRVFLPLRSVQ